MNFVFIVRVTLIKIRQIWLEIWLETDLAGFPKNGRISDLLKLEPKSGTTLLVIQPTNKQTNIQCESKKSHPGNFLTIFPKQLGIFSPNFTCLLYVPIDAGLQIFIQLTATLTKLCHIKCYHHNVLKMSTINRNARWVVALNMA